MARDASVRIDFGDGEYVFRLGIKEMLALQDVCNKPRLALMIALGAERLAWDGPGAIFMELGKMNYSSDQVREAMLLGLMGGGMAPAAAKGLLARYFDYYPLVQTSEFVMLMIKAACGMDEETVAPGKFHTSTGAAAVHNGSTDPTIGSTTGPSTETGPFSGFPPDRLMN